MHTRRIAVLHDAIPANPSRDELDEAIERDSVSQALSDLGYVAVPVPFSLDIKETTQALHKIEPVMVFNLVEGVQGKGFLICTAPAILDSMGIPYTGSNTVAIYMTSNKLIAKDALKRAGIPTPQWITTQGPAEGAFTCGSPYIIKSVWEHASIGIDGNSVIFPSDKDHLLKEMALRRTSLGGACFAEAYIDGREFNLSILDGEVLPPAEIIFCDYPENKWKIVDYKAKWHEESFEYSHTTRSFDHADSDMPVLRQMIEIAQSCWDIFNLGGYARVDFRVDLEGRPWVLEVNANPCIAPDSGFVAAAYRSGMDFNEVIRKIIHV